jgi:hypothetical protein
MSVFLIPEAAVRRGLPGLVMACAVMSSSTAWAGDAPVVTHAPDIHGDPVVGQTLQAADGAWTGSADAAANYTWLRCPDSDFEDCITIPQANDQSYTLTGEDAGYAIRVTLLVSLGDDSDHKTSDPTATVSTPSGETPTPTAPNGSPVAPSFVVAPPKGGGTVPAGAKLLKPKPVIRISGRYTAGGARITRFTVLAPKGATVKMSCTTRTCPIKRQTIKGGRTTHLKKLERTLKRGTRITLTISRPGYVSQISTIVIRAKRAPSRSDRCRLPGKRTTQRCPA